MADDPLIIKPIDSAEVEILADESFQASVREVQNLTFLDTPRLANLWQLCRCSNSKGSIIEVGAYRGGSALHLSNSCAARRIYICDSFEGFGDLPIDAELDHLFVDRPFADIDMAEVQVPWRGKGRDAVWIKGIFPGSAAKIDIRDISFAHIDVDVYSSTLATLEYLASRFIERSIIVLDDYLRGTGVAKAVREFLATHRDWAVFPVFPGQAVMMHRSWYREY